MTATTPQAAPERKLFQQLHAFPVLSAEAEQELSRRWRDTQDIAAANQIVTAHLRLVAKIASGYRGYGLPIGDLVSEGSVGLMQALRRYDPERGIRFSTYAMWWIRAAMQEHILHSWSLVRVGTTAAQKKLFFKLRRLKSQMQILDEGDLQPEQVTAIARSLTVPEQDVINMNRRLGSPTLSLNMQVRHDADEEWQDCLADESASLETTIANREELEVRQAMLPAALDTLNARERHILTERRLKDEPASLEDLSNHYGISRERVRQIEMRAFEKVQKSVKAQMNGARRGRPGSAAAGRTQVMPSSGARQARQLAAAAR